MLEAVDRVNERAEAGAGRQDPRALRRRACKGKTLAVWGLAFKPRTDDIREAPSLVLIDALLADGVQLRVHDPEAIGQRHARSTATSWPTATGPTARWKGPTAWRSSPSGRSSAIPDFEVMRRLMREPVIFDGRNLYDPKTPAAHGFVYYSIGRKTAGRE